ncbi:MAG: 30S ribosomal protein S21 [Nitrospiraceae bacterium]|nr:30S ribosomal protein S21 [Nitrospiraceae bacterium]
MEIKVNGNDIEKALKIFKREVQKDGLLKELRERQYYEKPSVRSRRKQREALKKKMKKVRLRASR